MRHYCDNRNHKQMERELVKSDWPASRTYALPTPEHVTGIRTLNKAWTLRHLTTWFNQGNLHILDAKPTYRLFEKSIR